MGSLQNLHRSLSTILIKVVLVKKFHFCFLHSLLLVLNKLLLANNKFLFCIDFLSTMTLGIHFLFLQNALIQQHFIILSDIALSVMVL